MWAAHVTHARCHACTRSHAPGSCRKCVLTSLWAREVVELSGCPRIWQRPRESGPAWEAPCRIARHNSDALGGLGPCSPGGCGHRAARRPWRPGHSSQPTSRVSQPRARRAAAGAASASARLCLSLGSSEPSTHPHGPQAPTVSTPSPEGGSFLHPQGSTVTPIPTCPEPLQRDTLVRVTVGTHSPLVCSGAQAPTPEIKAAWVSEIRKVLTSQLQACRGESPSPGLPPGARLVPRSSPDPWPSRLLEGRAHGRGS